MATSKKTDVKVTRPRGRPRVNLEFHEARELVRNENISSVAQYKKWWQLNTPAKIPKRPDRAYKKDWAGWNDFLGSNNPFPCVKKNFRSFDEARTFVQQQGFRSSDEYMAWSGSGNRPYDIPSRPDLVYREDWFTWKDFLGSDIAAVKRNIEKAGAVFFIIQNASRPRNVYQLGITMEGVKTIVDSSTKHRFKIVGLYYCDDIALDWRSMAMRTGKQFLDGGRQDEFVFNNVGDFIFELSDHVEKVR